MIPATTSANTRLSLRVPPGTRQGEGVGPGGPGKFIRSDQHVGRAQVSGCGQRVGAHGLCNLKAGQGGNRSLTGALLATGGRGRSELEHPNECSYRKIVGWARHVSQYGGRPFVRCNLLVEAAYSGFSIKPRAIQISETDPVGLFLKNQNGAS
jgi:hypothetical protein